MCPDDTMLPLATTTADSGQAGGGACPAPAGDRIADFCRAVRAAFGDQALAVAEAQLAAASDETAPTWRAIVGRLETASLPAHP